MCNLVDLHLQRGSSDGGWSSSEDAVSFLGALVEGNGSDGVGNLEEGSFLEELPVSGSGGRESLVVVVEDVDLVGEFGELLADGIGGESGPVGGVLGVVEGEQAVGTRVGVKCETRQECLRSLGVKTLGDGGQGSSFLAWLSLLGEIVAGERGEGLGADRSRVRSGVG